MLQEALEERIRQLEQRLEAEASNAQRDRLAVARLQHQLSKVCFFDNIHIIRKLFKKVHILFDENFAVLRK